MLWLGAGPEAPSGSKVSANLYVAVVLRNIIM